jgi:hypothetical protein
MGQGPPMYEMEGPRTVSLHRLPITRPPCVALPTTGAEPPPEEPVARLLDRPGLPPTRFQLQQRQQFYSVLWHGARAA